MVKKLQKIVASKTSTAKKSASKASPDTESPLANAVKDSAQQIWQAGLGAFNRAQAEAYIGCGGACNGCTAKRIPMALSMAVRLFNSGLPLRDRVR